MNNQEINQPHEDVPNLQIHGEYFLPVEHNLLGKPDATIEDIKYVGEYILILGTSV